MEKIYIGTNWKMTKTISEGITYCRELMEVLKILNEEQIQLFIIPSYTALTSLKNEIGNEILIGSQNMHWESEGPYTGEISPVMLKEIGINLVELGHSERRQYYNETDKDLNKKVHSALKHNLTPLLCIGETLEQKNDGISKEVLSSQLRECLRGVTGEQMSQVMVAYEPVWAIGNGGSEAPRIYVHQIHEYLRTILIEMYGDIGKNVKILFGGSVNRSNAIGYLEGKEVNGLFIGRSAWNIETFRPILEDVKSFINK